MDAPLAVLLRDGTHAGATNRLALKAEQLAVSIQRKPIVQDLPQTSPLIIDLAQNKPGITLSGMIDNVGTDKSVGLSNTDIGFWHMEKMTVSGPNAAGTGVENQTYYVPYKNYLENKIVTWGTSTDKLQLEIGDASITEYDISNMADVAFAGRSEAGTISGDSLTNSDSDVGITVSDASYFYDNNEQLIQIGNEIMRVGNISGSTLTVWRGEKGTTRTSHSDGAQIYALGIAPGSNGYATGGGIYNVAIAQAQFTMVPGEESRWIYNISFAAELRKGIKF